MSRYIDADALNDVMYHEAFENDESYNEKNPMAKWDSGLWIRYKMFENAIADAPSIDIVRCAECKYYEAKEDWCYWRDEAITADDFCSYGEVRDE